MPERYLSASMRNNRRHPALFGNLTGVEAAIHDRIWNAIMDRKLRPGAKLHEDMVGNAFGISRTIVRKVFLIMEQEGIITLPLNRGAFVATPTPEEIPLIFETARLVMPYIIRKVAEGLDDDSRSRLEMHFDIDDNLDAAQEIRTLRRLAQEFFILLADIHGNPVLSALIERVVIRVGLALTLYQDPIVNWRPTESARAINQAILEGKVDTAVELMESHFQLLENSLQFENPESVLDIGMILTGGDDKVYAKSTRTGKSRGGRKPLKTQARNGATPPTRERETTRKTQAVIN